MAGEWAPADDTDLADALAPFAERLTDLIPKASTACATSCSRGCSPGGEHADGSRHNIHRHYDLSNEMFAQFLDPTLSYSCALFDALDPAPTQADHEAAQLRKIDAVLDAAGVRDGSRVLEIGTGWGSLAIRAAAARRDGHHAHHLRAAGRPRPHAHRGGRGHRPGRASSCATTATSTATYDAVVSVEMIEAVGEKYWPTYFRKIDEVLAPGGKAAIQAILLEHHRMVATREHLHVDPQVHLPRRSAALDRGDRGGARRAHDACTSATCDRFGQHYAHTLRLWRERFLANWDEVEALGFDDTFRRMWEFYLAYCEAGFRSGYLDDAILTIER